MEAKLLLSILILVFVILILITFLWGWSLNKELKSTPVVVKNPPNIKTPNPHNKTLFSSQKTKSQPYSGYNPSALQNPCKNTSISSGLTNLPDAYELETCGFGKTCSDTLFKGSVCLSNIGFPCITKTDCVSEANDCLNNICVSLDDKLNTVCVDDTDCQSETTPNNMSCVITNRSKIKRCKVNNYPLGYGCNTYADCSDNDKNNDVVCIDGISTLNSYGLSCTYDSNIFTITNEDEYLTIPFVNKLLKDQSIVLVSDEIESFYYKIKEFNPPSTFRLEEYLSKQYTKPLTFVNGNTYNLEMLASVNNESNICVSRIPLGGKFESVNNPFLKTILEEMPNPCAGLGKKVNKGEDNYCISDDTDLSKVGSFCDTSSTGTYPQALKCNQDKSNDFVKDNITYKLSCLYDETLDNNLQNNYNYTETDDYKTIGKCLYPISKAGDNCNTNIMGCSIPYICTENNICLESFDTTDCYFNDYCSVGFNCKDKKCIPDDGNICLGENCNNILYLYKFDHVEDKYIKSYTLGINGNVSDFEIALGKNYIDDEISNVVIFDKSKNILRSLIWSGGKYILNKTHQFIFNDVEYHSVMLDKKDRILISYSNISKNCRKRKYKITGVDTTEGINNQKLMLDTNFSCLTEGISMYFEGETQGIMDENTLYHVYEYSGNGISSRVKLGLPNGNIITQYTVDFLLDGYLTTYDNRISYNIQNYNSDYEPYGGLSFTAGIGKCNIDDTEKYSWVYTGDSIKLEEGSSIEITCPTYGISPVETIDSNNIYYVNESSIYDNSYSYYLYSDNFNASDGSVPFINEKKFISQNLKPSADCIARIQPNIRTYGVYYLDETSTHNNVTINSDEFYTQGVSMRLNGMPTVGITYGFEDGISLKFESNDENIMLVNSDIGYGISGSVVKYLKYTQKMLYDISNSFDSAYNYNYKMQNGDWFNFTYTNNSVIPFSKNYFKDTTFDEIKTNLVDDVFHNNFSIQNNEDFNFINTVINNSDNILNKSQMKKMVGDYTQTENFAENITFKNLDNVFNTGAPTLKGGLIEIKTQTDKNTFISGQTLITINNQDDIDLILKYGSSEIALVKSIALLEGSRDDMWNDPALELDEILYDGNFLNSWVDPYVTRLQNGEPNVILIITDIIEHNVELNSEYLICKINRPVLYDIEKDTGDNQLESYIIDDTTQEWKLYVYNYVPLCYRSVTGCDAQVYFDESRFVNIFDSSGLYTSTKKNNFFNDSSTGYTRTSYNKIIGETLDGYSVYNIQDGAGVKYDGIDLQALSTASFNPVSLSNDQNNYDTNFSTTDANIIVYNDNTMTTGFYPYDIEGQRGQFILYNTADTSLINTVNDGISHIALAYNVMLPNTFTNQGNTVYVATDVYPDPRLNNNFTFGFYPCGRLSKMFMLTGRPHFTWYDDGTTFDPDEAGYRTMFGSGFDLGFTVDEKAILEDSGNFISIYKNFGNNVSPSVLVSCMLIYSKLIKKYTLNGRSIAMENIIIGPQMSGMITLTCNNSGDICNLVQQGNMYMVNNLFLSTLSHISNLDSGRCKFNNQNLIENFIISNKSSSDNYKSKGSLNLGLDSFSIAVSKKTSGVVLTNLDQSSIEIGNFPNINNLKYEILRVFYRPNNDIRYCVYTKYTDLLNTIKYQMFYLNANKDIVEDSGIPISDPYNPLYSDLKNNFIKMGKDLYIIAFDT